MKRITNVWKHMSKRQRVEGVLAAVLTLSFFTGFPAFAWFSYSNSLQTYTKIKEPESLDIRAGNTDVIQNFELKEIDLKKSADSGVPIRYVFSVITDNESSRYDIQLAHTTNIPVKYTLYKADKLTVAEGATPAADTYDLEYSPTYIEENGEVIHVRESDQKSYYKRVDKSEGENQATPAPEIAPRPLDWTDLNVPGDTNNNNVNDSVENFGRVLAIDDAQNSYYNMTYNATGAHPDAPQLYAIPIYSRSETISTRDPDGDYFILELTWDTNGNYSNIEGFKEWNSNINNKETDIIYISARKVNG